MGPFLMAGLTDGDRDIQAHPSEVSANVRDLVVEPGEAGPWLLSREMWRFRARAIQPVPKDV